MTHILERVPGTPGPGSEGLDKAGDEGNNLSIRAQQVVDAQGIFN